MAFRSLTAVAGKGPFNPLRFTRSRMRRVWALQVFLLSGPLSQAAAEDSCRRLEDGETLIRATRESLLFYSPHTGRLRFTGNLAGPRGEFRPPERQVDQIDLVDLLRLQPGGRFRPPADAAAAPDGSLLFVRENRSERVGLVRMTATSPTLVPIDFDDRIIGRRLSVSPRGRIFLLGLPSGIEENWASANRSAQGRPPRSVPYLFEVRSGRLAVLLRQRLPSSQVHAFETLSRLRRGRILALESEVLIVVGPDELIRVKGPGVSHRRRLPAGGPGSRRRVIDLTSDQGAALILLRETGPITRPLFGSRLPRARSRPRVLRLRPGGGEFEEAATTQSLTRLLGVLEDGLWLIADGSGCLRAIRSPFGPAD